MKWKTLAVLALVALAGCGGGDDDNDSNAADTAGDGGAAAPADTSAQEPAAGTVKGELTDAKFIKLADLQKKGAAYVWSDGCEVTAVATSPAAVKKLQKAASNKNLVIPNKSGSAAIQIAKQTYPCAIHASLVLRTIP